MKIKEDGEIATCVFCSWMGGMAVGKCQKRQGARYKR